MSSHVAAANLSLSNAPLYLSVPVQPSITFLLDDSGSMESEVLIDGVTDGFYEPVAPWDGGTYTPATDPNDQYLRGRYILPTNNNGMDTGWQAYAADPLVSGSPALSDPYHPYTIFDFSVVTDASAAVWRLKAHAYNLLYYNPEKRYDPWPGVDAGGNPLYANATATAAWIDPNNTSAGTLDLTTDVSYGHEPDPTSNATSSGVYPATYYQWTDTNGNGVLDAVDSPTLVEIKLANAPFTGSSARTDCVAAPNCTYAEEIQNFANWFTYHRKRIYAMKAALGKTINAMERGYVDIAAFNAAPFDINTTAINTTILKATKLAQLYAIEATCGTTYSAGVVSIGACNSSPARSALSKLGELYANSETSPTSPILDVTAGGACQSHVSVIATDGYSNGVLSSAEQALYADDDSDSTSTYDSGHHADTTVDDGDPATIDTETLADIAMFYYENDLAPWLADQVPSRTPDHPKHQHLRTYLAGFGATGELDPYALKTPAVPADTDPTDAGFDWPEIQLGISTDGDISSTYKTLDDMWHAAYNGRGVQYQAQDAQAFSESFNAALLNILAIDSSASSVALNSGYLTGNSHLYQATFDSLQWTGQLLAYPINTDGSLGSIVWDAGCELTGGNCDATGSTATGITPNNRTIWTSTPPASSSDHGTGVAFRWDDIGSTNQALLNTNPDTGAVDSVGASRLLYLRGGSHADFRSRESLLGDIIDASPVFAGTPPFAYPDSLEADPYSGFVAAQLSRKAMVYVGANDGMLHGFDASDGKELLAYVPSKVYANLPALTSANYASTLGHRYYVNAPPNVGDVYADLGSGGKSWGTVLVGGLGNGGQSLYALNVTDPTTFDESAASSKVLWEFTDVNDADLGRTYGQPAIVRMANGQWAAIIGNGYNNTEADGHVSSTGNAVIYVIDIEDGSVIKKFDTGKGMADDPSGTDRPNGIATVTPVDLNADYTVDLIYAGDLFGNVWKMDVSNTSTASWAFAGSSGGASPLFIAKNDANKRLPITTAPEVGLHATLPGQMVYVGTGKYLETTDANLVPYSTQSMFAIWDRNQSTFSNITRSHLLSQSIDEEVSHPSGGDVRITSNHPMHWYVGSGTPTTPSSDGYVGWYMDLLQPGTTHSSNQTGERITANPLLRDGKLIFATMMLSDDPCTVGGSGWLMELDAANGARLSYAPFDLNGDGIFTLSDLVTNASGDSVAVSGVKSEQGIIATPVILQDNNSAYAGGGGNSGSGREFKYAAGSSGNIETITENRGASTIGRQSWRQIK